jgi:hypothetical protein
MRIFVAFLCTGIVFAGIYGAAWIEDTIWHNCDSWWCEKGVVWLAISLGIGTGMVILRGKPQVRRKIE